MTQKEIIKECRRILNSIHPNQYVENETDLNFLLDAFSQARYYEYKTRGRKIVRIQKRASGNYGTFCFFIELEDGRIADFSYSKMFSKNPELEDVLAAMRTAIDPIISEFRRNFKPFVYEGQEISKVEDAHVDHYDLTFIELAAKWIEKKGGAEQLIRYVNETKDGSTSTFFTDQSLIDDFVSFHNANTHLRFVPKSVNLSAAKNTMQKINKGKS